VRDRWGTFPYLPQRARDRKSSRKRNWKIAAVVLAAFLLLLLLLFRVPLLVALGNFVVSDDPLEEADVVVVLMGSIPDRIVQGVQLYERGYSGRIVMVRSHDFSNYELVEALGMELPGSVDINRDIALHLGVPAGDITILDERADSTWDEAVAVKGYLRHKDYDSLLLVTSRFHSTRSKKTFERVLGERFTIISHPSPYDPYDPRDWWRCRRQARNLLFEYQKLLNLYLFQR